MNIFYTNIKNILVITLPTLVILLIFLELFFRFVIPASDPPGDFFYEDEKLFSFPTNRETGLYTIGRFAEIKARWQINNMGWNYPIDYYPDEEKKLIAIIGDSFIEALQVDAEKNYPFLLREKLYPNYEIYAFGKSGAALSQYLHLSRYVNKHFDPNILIFNIVHNDFDQSISELDPSRHYFLQLSYNELYDSFYETLPRPDYSLKQYNPWKRLLYNSSVFRYLWLNIKVHTLSDRILSPINQFEANINSVKVKEDQSLVTKATKYLVKTIKEENPKKRIIFIFDAHREAIYNNSLDNSSLIWMHEMMRNVCEKHDVEYIDLTEPMQQDFMTNSREFNSKLEGHWDEYGHEFVANILYEYLKNRNQ